VGSPTELAGGISQALITTAAGISVAVPALIFHRYFRAKINGYAIEMEKETMKLIDTINRKPAVSGANSTAAVQAAKQKLMAQQQANARAQQQAKGNLA
jgi:biopolymer transport protein ExbB